MGTTKSLDRLFLLRTLLKSHWGLSLIRSKYCSNWSGVIIYSHISHLLSYVDDISSCVCLKYLSFLCDQLKSRHAKIGCFVNPSKTRIFTSCNVSSILPLLHTHNLSLANSLSNTIGHFSTTPHPTDKNVQALTIKLVTGFCLLGHPIKSPTFTTVIGHGLMAGNIAR